MQSGENARYNALTCIHIYHCAVVATYTCSPLTVSRLSNILNM